MKVSLALLLRACFGLECAETYSRILIPTWQIRMLYSRQRSVPSCCSGGTVCASTLSRCRLRRGAQAGRSCCSVYWDTDWLDGLGCHKGSRSTTSAHTHIHTYTVSSFTYLYSSVCVSCTCYCAQSGTDFGLWAVLGEMSVPVAVSTLDVLASVVSVWHALHCSLVFVIDPSLKHTQFMHHLHHVGCGLTWMFCNRKI